MVHGLLHLLGYDDKTRSDQDLMRQAENNALELLEEIRNGKQI
jgi:ssRNA-specific RNase YbeY (16S rRNA maturation enzyme)